MSVVFLNTFFLCYFVQCFSNLLNCCFFVKLICCWLVLVDVPQSAGILLCLYVSVGVGVQRWLSRRQSTQCCLSGLWSVIKSTPQLVHAWYILRKFSPIPSRTWLDLCLELKSEGHRSIISIQLCLLLPPPSSSSCTCILLSTFLSLHLFSKYSLVTLPLWPFGVHCNAGLAMLSSFLLNVCSSQFHFLLDHTNTHT